MSTYSLFPRCSVMRAIALFVLAVAVISGCTGQQTAGVGTGGTGGNQYAMGGSIQGKALALKNEVAAIAGNTTTTAGSAGSTDGIGTAARFNGPNSITSDGTNLYVADYYNNVIRKIVIATGAVTTLAGAAGMPGSADGIGAAASFNCPAGITTDGANLYVTEVRGNTIRKIVISSGAVTTLAGTAGVTGSLDGTGASAQFYGPFGIATDGTALYVADSGNSTIRKVEIATGTVTTVAGTAGILGTTDGIGAAASFIYPVGVALNGADLYVTEQGGIRKIALTSGTVTTFADTVSGQDITSDGLNLYVPSGYTIHKIVLATGEVTTLAGTAGVWGSADGSGAAASFNGACGITIVGTNLYVTEFTNNTIRKIEISGAKVTTLAGTANPSAGSSDGRGSAASFYAPLGITTDGINLYVADMANHTIRKIEISTGEVTTLAGSAGSFGFDDGIGTAARFGSPWGITTDGKYLYVIDFGWATIRKISISTGAVTTLAGGAYGGSVDGTGTAAGFSAPMGITTDGTNLYVADSWDATIRKVVISTGVVTTLAGSAGNHGAIDGIGAAARFDAPQDITTDGKYLYVADLNNTIRKIEITTGTVTTVVGPAARITDGGSPVGYRGITMDGTNLYVTSDATNTVQKVELATGVVTLVAGSTGNWGSADGVGTLARFNIPVGITTDGISLFVADAANNTIRRIQ